MKTFKLNCAHPILRPSSTAILRKSPLTPRRQIQVLVSCVPECDHVSVSLLNFHQAFIELLSIGGLAWFSCPTRRQALWAITPGSRTTQLWPTNKAVLQ